MVGVGVDKKRQPQTVDLLKRKSIQINLWYTALVSFHSRMIWNWSSMDWSSSLIVTTLNKAIALCCYSVRIETEKNVKSKLLDFTHFSTNYYFFWFVLVRKCNPKNDICRLVVRNIRYLCKKHEKLDWDKVHPLKSLENDFFSLCEVNKT